MALVNNQIYAALNLDQRFQEEVYMESLDAADLSEDVLKERRDSLVQKYRHKRLDLIVLVGPDPVRVFAEPSKIPDLQGRGSSWTPRRPGMLPSLVAQARFRPQPSP
jgi:hypothetical protein